MPMFAKDHAGFVSSCCSKSAMVRIDYEEIAERSGPSSTFKVEYDQAVLPRFWGANAEIRAMA